MSDKTSAIGVSCARHRTRRLVTSTLLNLFLLPALYAWFGSDTASRDGAVREKTLSS